MPTNYVEIAIKARDDAKPPLDDLKLALDALSHKVSTALAEVDDKEAEATLLRLNSKLDDVGRKIESPRITVAGADKALADLAAIDVALDRVGSKGSTAGQSVSSAAYDAGTALSGMRDSALAADEAFTGGRSAIDDYHAKLSGLSLLLRETDQGAADAALSLESVGPAVGQAAEDTSMALPSLAAVNPMMAGMGAAIAAAVPVVIGAGTSLAAMGAAGALAYPEIKQVMDVLSGAATAPGSGPIAQAVSEIRDLESAYKQAASVSGIGANLISKALPAGIETVENLLRDMSPLARAGAVSIDEIAKAGERVSSSSGFKGFLDDLGKQAPADTSALLGLAGSVGGDLKAAFEAAAPHIGLTLTELSGMTDELKGPLSTAVGGTVQGVGVMADIMTGAIGTASALSDEVSAAWEGISHSVGGSAQDAAHSVNSFRSSESAVKNPSVLEFIGALSGNFSLVNKSAVESATAMGRHEAAAQKAAAEDATFGHQMDIASGSAGTLADRVTALTTAIGRESDATAGALGSEVSFHQQLLTTIAAMQASGDKAGYMNSKSLATAAAFVQLYAAAKSASAGLLEQTHSASDAAGPLIALRDEMEKIQGPTAAETQLLRGINAEIARLKSKTITIGVNVVDETGGAGSQPLPVGGGPTGHPQGGPDSQGMMPGAMNPAALPPPGSTGESPAYAAMRKYMESVRQSVLQDATLSNVQASAGTHKIGGKGYLTGLQDYLSKIRKFEEALKKLKHDGLDRQLLAQVIDAFQSDPDSGLQMAEALANGPMSRIYNLNKTERQIEAASKKLGQTAGRSQFAVGGGGGNGTGPEGIEVTLHAGSSDRLMRAIFEAMRVEVRRLGGRGPDSVQKAFGHG